MGVDDVIIVCLVLCVVVWIAHHTYAITTGTCAFNLHWYRVLVKGIRTRQLPGHKRFKQTPYTLHSCHFCNKTKLEYHEDE